jgi:TRAP transporter 4TM/12TM fusion protein
VGVALCLFTLVEVNRPHLGPQAQLAIFALLGLALCFLGRPLAWPRRALGRAADAGLALLAAACCLYVVVQTEPAFSGLWTGGRSLGNRAGQETPLDVAVALVGMLVVLEATRRTIGWTLPLLSVAFVAYAWLGSDLPAWLLPHRGYDLPRIAAQVFLHGQGVFGVALSVMFTYVFLFLLFGAFLEATGATGYLLDAAQRLFGATAGGPAKVAVVSSALMGSLSGSAVANTATTGTFTIPMMRRAGLSRETACGIEAAASSGGALMPPVMGAGAYMMLEIVSPPVTYLQVIRAALVPALLYYLSIFLIVHFHVRRLGVRPPAAEAPGARPALLDWRGAIFLAALASLLGFLLAGYTAFRAVTLALGAIVVLGALRPRTRLGLRQATDALARTARDGVPLVAAAACVGIIVAVVTLTGLGTRLPGLVVPLAEGHLLAALALIMVSSLVLGMGLPSAVCYLLMATLMGPALSELGVVPLAAHLFIFYFGMMSMVTPPVALAAYAAASIAQAPVLAVSLAAFRFALVGFTLPYMFVYRPELLLLGEQATAANVGAAVLAAAAGILAFAAAIAGHLATTTTTLERVALFAAALLLLAPAGIFEAGGFRLAASDLAGGAVLLAAAVANVRRGRRGDLTSPA